jgi:hypothetical protein
MVGSRYQLVDSPAYVPAEDIITRTTVGPFIDAGAWIPPSPRQRRVYLAVSTIQELAEAAGIVSTTGASEQQLAAARAEGALAVLKENLGGDLAAILRRLGDLVPESDGLGSLAVLQDATARL